MTKVNLETRIGRVLKEAIELADIGGASTATIAIAGRIYDSEPELMTELQRPWMVDRLNWMIARMRRDRRRAKSADDQLALPGFESLPRTIFLRDGARQKLDNANTTQVREHVKMLRSRLKHHAKIDQMEAVLELMRKHSHEKHGITWAEVKRKELES